MSMIQEFRDFAMKGNVIDLAVGVVIGGAFGKIVSSLVGDIVMPGIVDPLVKSLGTNWKEFAFMNMKVGAFAGSVIDFLVVAFVIFMLVKAMNSTTEKISETISGKKEEA